MRASDEFDWDAFVSHASEDKDSFVVPLVTELQKYGLKIWFDQFTLRVGSSLHQVVALEDVMSQHSTLCIAGHEAPEFSTVFGTTLDLGPYYVIVQPREIEVRASDG